MSSSSSSLNVTYHLTSQESMNIDDIIEIDDDYLLINDSDHEDTIYTENIGVSKRSAKYTDLSNLLKNGMFKTKISKVLEEHKDNMIQNTNDHDKVDALSKELTLTINRIDNFEETAEIQRIKMILYYIMEMCVDPDGKNLGVFIPPKLDYLQREIFQHIFVPYMKSLPATHQHSIQQQKALSASKQFGYRASGSLARLIVLGVCL